MKKFFPGAFSKPPEKTVISELRKSLRHKAASMLSLLIGVSFIGGCSISSADPFPKVTQPTESASVSSSPAVTTGSELPTETTSSGMPVLRVAAPITNDTAQYLLKL